MALGGLITVSPLRTVFGFSVLPLAFFAILLGMIVTYLFLVEVGKTLFFRRAERAPQPLAPDVDHAHRRFLRRATWLRVRS